MMESSGMNVPLTSGSKLILRVAGDLHIKGTEEASLSVSGRARVQQNANVCNVVVESSGWVNVPSGVDVQLEHVGGDGVVSGVFGALEIAHVGGELVLYGTGKLDINHVGGDLTAVDVRGPMVVRRVGGDLSADVDGDLSVDMVGGNMKAQAKGAVRVRAGGDVEVGLLAGAAEEVSLRAGGDISIHAPADISARMDLTSGGEDIVVDFLNQHRSMEQENYILTLGNGDRAVRARAGGDIAVTDQPIRLEDVREECARADAGWEARHAGHGGRHGEFEFEERIARRAEEVARRAEKRVKAAMERVERQTRFQDRSFGKWGKWFGVFGMEETPARPESAPQPPEPPAAPVAAASEASAPVAAAEPAVNYASAMVDITNEERMLVLKMLQEKKISVEEAEQLLAALEGQFD